MLGGLYGDLPPPSTEEERPTAINAWSNSSKMAPAALRKPSSLLSTPHTLLKSQSRPKPSSSAAIIIPAAEEGRRSPRFEPALVGVTATVVEEYDPGRPNDYEEFVRERKRKGVEAERRREIERRRKEEEEEEEAKKKRERDAVEKERENSLNISGEEAWRRRAAMSGIVPRSPSPPSNGDSGFSIGKSETGGLGVGAGGHMTAAQRMMAKMGWKEGQGLGKQEQGITIPLIAKKTDRRAGVIVNASEPKPDRKVKSVSFNGPPTRVLMLRNMVGPGEVDDELEDEVGSECAKYGTVTRVLIFEITEANFPAEEAVRIFIQFDREEETTKALVDLDGRYFGGRVVRASFYDEDRFGKNELAPMPGEIPGYI